MLPQQDPYDSSHKGTNTEIIIAEALQQIFGADAMAVAKLQQRLATNETLARWDEIVAYLMA